MWAAASCTPGAATTRTWWYRCCRLAADAGLGRAAPGRHVLGRRRRPRGRRGGGGGPVRQGVRRPAGVAGRVLAERGGCRLVPVHRECDRRGGRGPARLARPGTRIPAAGPARTA